MQTLVETMPVAPQVARMTHNDAPIRRRDLRRRHRPLVPRLASGLVSRFAARPALQSIFLGVLGAVFAIIRAFVPSPTGLADNGRATELMCQLGFEPTRVTSEAFVVFDWVTHTSSGGTCSAYPSSAEWLVRPAEWLSSFIAPGTVDLRWILLVFCIAIGMTVAAVTRVLRASFLLKAVVSVVLTVALADGVFLATAGGGYPEIASITGLLLLLVGILFTTVPGPAQWGGLIVTLTGAALLVGASPASAPLTLPIAILLLAGGLQVRRRGEASERTRGAAFQRRILPFAGVAALVTFAFGGFCDLIEKHGPEILAEITTPTQWWDTATNVGNAFFQVAPPELGTVALDSGQAPGTVTYSLIAELSQILGGFGLFPALLLWALIGWGVRSLYRATTPRTAARAFARSSALSLSLAICSVGTIAVTTTTDLIQQMVVAVFATTVATVMLFTGAICARNSDQSGNG